MEQVRTFIAIELDQTINAVITRAHLGRNLKLEKETTNETPLNQTD